MALPSCLLCQFIIGIEAGRFRGTINHGCDSIADCVKGKVRLPHRDPGEQMLLLTSDTLRPICWIAAADLRAQAA